MKQEATLIRARLKTPRAAAGAVYEKFGYDFCDTRDPKVEANEANRAAHLQSSLPPVRDRRRNAVAPTHASPNLRRRSGKPRRVHHSERLDEPGRQAAVWLRGNESSPGCLCGQRQCGQWYPEVPGRTFPFTVGGLGVGGIGISKIEAKGEVYGLERLRDFPGAYIQDRYGLPWVLRARATCG